MERNGQDVNPSVTVCIITLNRGNVIREAFHSILSQSYPKSRVSIVIVDGGSTDNTVGVCRNMLSGSEVANYEITVQKSTIPEARNICISKATGDFLLFWDSDIIMSPDAIEKLVEASVKTGIEILSADVKFTKLNNLEEGWRLLESYTSHAMNKIEYTPAVTMSATLLRRKVAEAIRFDPDLTLYEDIDFCMRAAKAGFKIAVHKGVIAVDLNLANEPSSDIFTGKPISELLRGLRKKAKAKVYALSPENNIKGYFKYIVSNPRYLVYLGYMPVLVLLAFALASNNTIFTLLPAIYICGYLGYQAVKRGLRHGLKAFAISLLVGMPLATLMFYYSSINSVKIHKTPSSH